MSLRNLLKIIISWRLIIFVFAVLGMFLLPFGDKFPYRESLLVPFGHPLFYSWANFDGVHYLGIARQGYFADFTQAFFPIFPLLIRLLNQFIHNYLLSGLIISHLSLVFALYYLVKLICLDHSLAVARKTLILLLLFPTSFYFGSLYTESLFLFFTLACFYNLRTNHPLRAIFWAGLASATRIIGVLIIPALIYDRYLKLKNKHHQVSLFSYLPYLLPALGLIAYMYYLNVHYSDPFYFLNAQPAFGAGRSSDKIILLYQVIYRYIKMLFTVNPYSLLYYTVNLEFWISMIFLILGLLAFKRIHPPYALYSFLAYLTPTLTGTFSSMPRYVLILFPCFILLGEIKNKKFLYSWLLISVILLAVNVILFTRGYWVA